MVSCLIFGTESVVGAGRCRGVVVRLMSYTSVWRCVFPGTVHRKCRREQVDRKVLNHAAQPGDRLSLRMYSRTAARVCGNGPPGLNTANLQIQSPKLLNSLNLLYCQSRMVMLQVSDFGELRISGFWNYRWSTSKADSRIA